MSNFQDKIRELRVEYYREINRLNNQLDKHIQNEMKLLEENKELHNKIDKLEDELNWYKQECDDLEMMSGVDESK